MGTTQDDIRGWLKEAKENGATHMLVVVDTFDHEDYPVSVMPGTSVREKFNEYNGKDMQRVMEVYALHADIEKQLNTGRNFNFDYPNPKASKAPVVSVRKADAHDSPIMKDKLSSNELFDVTSIINYISDREQLELILKTVQSRLDFSGKVRRRR